MTIRRREFITLLGGTAAAWPLAARGQQRALPVIGYLNGLGPEELAQQLAPFLRGLGEAGYIEGRNVAIERRSANGELARLPALAAELANSRVAVIAAAGLRAAQAAKAATATIPIVFQVGRDPVEIGLVASLNRPGGNLTGVSNLNVELGPKRLELLHELVPRAALVALLVNPTNPDITQGFLEDVQPAAPALGLKLEVLQASSDQDLDAAFATLERLNAGALLIATDPFLISRSAQLAALAMHHRVPTISQFREFPAAGGLMSYGADFADVHRQVGVYAGRILSGAKPGDLPVQQSAKIELVINLKTAKALGLTIPITLLGRADEVVE